MSIPFTERARQVYTEWSKDQSDYTYQRWIPGESEYSVRIEVLTEHDVLVDSIELETTVSIGPWLEAQEESLNRDDQCCSYSDA